MVIFVIEIRIKFLNKMYNYRSKIKCKVTKNIRYIQIYHCDK